MSGLAGVRWLDDRRHGTIADVRPVLTRLALRGPDGLHAARSGPCVSGVAHLITDGASAAGRPPLILAESLIVSFDGRLDNAGELRSALGRSPRDLPADVDVVAAAWSAWGETAPRRLLGDFALVVWNDRTRTLYLARDVFGLRPLLYRVFNGGFWWASELQALARLGGAAINDGVVAEYLATEIRSETDTLVSGVLRVPRAAVVTVSADGRSRTTRYWTPRVESLRRFRDDREPVEQFRALFADAVKCRLRAQGPIALTLSGGLDSSLIAAESVRQTGGDRLHAYTLSLPGDHADESPFAEAVARHVHMPWTCVPVGRATLAPIVDDADRTLELPQPPNSVAANAFSELMRERDVRVCLNGVGGNEWFSGYHFPFADMLRQLRWVGMVRRMRAFARETPSYRPTNDLRLALWLQLPEVLKRQVRQALSLPRLPPWIQPAFARQVDLAQRLRPATGPAALPTHQLRLMFDAATSADQMFFTEYNERISAKFGCEERSPFLDRRLAEWALSLPDNQRWRDGAGKVLLRHAARDVLPSTVADRVRGPDFSFLTVEGLQQLGGERFVMSIARERADWVAPPSVHQLWARTVGLEKGGDRGLGYYSWAVWMLVAVHLAVRAIERTDARAHACHSSAAIKERTIRMDSQKEAS